MPGQDDRTLPAAGDDRLESWKDIATFFNRGVRTVQRWELTESLPVHRHTHAKRGSVFAFRSELERWRDSRRWTEAGDPDATEPQHAEPSIALPAPHDVAPTAKGQDRGRTVLPWVVASTLAAIAVPLWLWVVRETTPAKEPSSSTPLLSRPLANESTTESYPSLSPDGRLVAYRWNKPGSPGIYVKSTSGGQAWPLPLDGPLPRNRVDSFPKWSPDGKWIAFLREVRPAIWDIHIVAAEGGRSRAILEISSASLSWFPDSRSLAVVNHSGHSEAYSVFLVDVDTGKILRRITAPPPSTFGDWQCAVSPDGTRLAVVRYTGRSDADVYVTSVREGESGIRRLTNWSRGIEGLDWTADGKSIIFASGPSGRASLWVISADAREGESPAFVIGTEGGLSHPSVAKGGALSTKLAFGFGMARHSVWKWNLVEGIASTPTQAAASGASDNQPAISPDGRTFVFVSTRSGWPELWSADLGGGENDVRQLTFRRASMLLAPRWSPDGHWITFTSNTGTNNDIFMVRSDGSALARVTSDPANEGNASWSRDGRWVYFSSTKNGLPQIWRVSQDRRAGPILVQTGEGSEAIESADGKTLYFVRRDGMPGLWGTPATGGPERLFLAGPHIWEQFWDVTKDGVIFLERDVKDRRDRQPLALYNPLKDKIESLGTLPVPSGLVDRGFSASRDGRWVLWAQNDVQVSDLRIVDPWQPDLAP